ncbi:MAG: hypothetical protein ABIR06_10330 [Cyclobacteriaceae bacterium]
MRWQLANEKLGKLDLALLSFEIFSAKATTKDGGKAGVQFFRDEANTEDGQKTSGIKMVNKAGASFLPRNFGLNYEFGQ